MERNFCAQPEFDWRDKFRKVPSEHCVWLDQRMDPAVAWIAGLHRWTPAVLASRFGGIGAGLGRRLRARSVYRVRWYAAASESEPRPQVPKQRSGKRAPFPRSADRAPSFPKPETELTERQWRRGPGARPPRQRDVLSPLQEKLQSGHDFLYGLAPVFAALSARRRAHFYELFLLDRLAVSVEHQEQQYPVPRRETKKAVEEQILLAANQQGVKIQRVDKGTLNTLCGNRPHQGFVLECSALEPVPMVSAEAFEPRPRVYSPTNENHEPRHPCWLALDEVWDPQNLGALLRSAYFFGCDGVMVSRKNSAGLTATVSKASSGAMEFMQVHAVSNMPRFLEQAHRIHGWRVLGTALPTSGMVLQTREHLSDGGGAPRHAQASRPVTPCAELALHTPTILVLGNEGHGLRTNVERACTAFAFIERGLVAAEDAALAAVDSLNVSVAGAILLHRLLHERGMR